MTDDIIFTVGVREKTTFKVGVREQIIFALDVREASVRKSKVGGREKIIFHGRRPLENSF